MGTGRRNWTFVRETLLALVVIALTFLNYGHVSVSAAGGFSVTPDSWCGDPLLPGSPDHSPCHACRIGSGADLPPPPAEILPVRFEAATVRYVEPPARPSTILLWRTPQPRGPPLFV